MRCRPVDPSHELTMLGLCSIVLTVADRCLQPTRQRLHGGAVAQILEPLTRCDPDPLLLLFDVRHREKTRGCGRGGW